jgi:hypothetical protein
MLWALTGFNLGIELAQIAVAAGAGLLWWALCRAVGPAAHGRAGQFATIAGMAGGTFWFIERVLQAV